METKECNKNYCDIHKRLKNREDDTDRYWYECPDCDMDRPPVEARCVNCYVGITAGEGRYIIGGSTYCAKCGDPEKKKFTNLTN